MNTEQGEMLEEILDYEHQLNDWESKFIDDLYNNYDERSLNSSQATQLIKIHTKVVC